MKRLLFCTALLVSMLACNPMDCTYNGHKLNVGPRGGCYYLNKNGNKTYVDRSYCACK
ncbi:hypothetical protein SIO70_00135 [Chitinophaga sancti]|uniref:hypothetical protein n=1 Tax=Chitinophaga sancti TaxID=1004 RepID=UPI002A758A9C|nr:hypothetical protein [Chitinophaga sancti]WPQ63270.1 hypothetical protein SIO70_00135 [Chitinophaga sancti]